MCGREEAAPFGCVGVCVCWGGVVRGGRVRREAGQGGASRASQGES